MTRSGKLHQIHSSSLTYRNRADVKPVVPFDPSTNVGRLTSDEFCQYAMTVHTEGISYSGRLNTLLNCDSLIIAHDLEWYTYW